LVFKVENIESETYTEVNSRRISLISQAHVKNLFFFFLIPCGQNILILKIFIIELEIFFLKIKMDLRYEKINNKLDRKINDTEKREISPKRKKSFLRNFFLGAQGVN